MHYRQPANSKSSFDVLRKSERARQVVSLSAVLEAETGRFQPFGAIARASVACAGELGADCLGAWPPLQVPAGGPAEKDLHASCCQNRIWPWVGAPMGSHFGVGAPPILEPILVGIGMFTGVRFGRWPMAIWNPPSLFFSSKAVRVDHGSRPLFNVP